MYKRQQEGGSPESSVGSDHPPPGRALPRPWARVRHATTRDELSTIERLRDGQDQLRDRLNGWIVTITITAIAFGIRFYNLAYPNKLIFDETYYPKDAWTLWRYGYEREWPDSKVANDQILNGDVNIYKDTAEFVVHPLSLIHI